MFRRLEDDQSLIFLHIPKTAGTSLVSQLSSLNLPWLHIYWPVFYPEIGKYLGGAQDRLKESAPAISAGQFRYVVGHFTQKDVIDTIGPDRRFLYAAMLRNPVDMIVSSYKYQLTPAHPEHEELCARWPTVDAYLDVMTQTNEMVHYLELRRGEPVDEIADRAFETYAFLGTVENYNESVHDLYACFDARPETFVHLNRGPSLSEPLRPDQVSRIEALNARDVELYRRLSARLAEQASELERRQSSSLV